MRAPVNRPRLGALEWRPRLPSLHRVNLSQKLACLTDGVQSTGLVPKAGAELRDGGVASFRKRPWDKWPACLFNANQKPT